MSAKVIKLESLDTGTGLPEVTTYAAKHTLSAFAAPTASDDDTGGWAPSSIWVWPATGVWVCQSNATGAAVWIPITAGGGSGAPTNADYLVKTTNGTLTAERVVQDSGFIAADWSAAGVVAFNIVAGSITTTQLGGDITAAGKALLDDANAAAQRTTLGLGTVATLASDTDATLAANSNANVPTQAAVKSYVDGLVTGLNWKHSVRAASTANAALATAYENGDTLDGVTLATGDRILIKNQTTGSENGIYTVNASGAPTRANDANTGAELVNATVLVEDGTTNADTQWTCTNNQTPTIGTTAIVFAQISGAGTYTATGGVQLSGNSFSLTTTGVTAATYGSTGSAFPQITVDANGRITAASNRTIAIDETMLTLSDVTNDNVTSTAHGFAPKSPADATKFLSGAATPAYAQVKDSDLSMSVVTTNDVTTAIHGFCPTAPNDTTKFFRGDATWATISAGFKTQTLLTSGTGAIYTTPAGCKLIRVTETGGGGGSGGCANTASNAAATGGGGEGATTIKVITSPAATYTYTVGAAGTAGAAGNNNGGAGGQTSFGTITANGGSGSAGSAAGTAASLALGFGAGGAAGATGDINMAGQNGGYAVRLSGSVARSGDGGAGYWGGGPNGIAAAGGGTAGISFGSGASGAVSLGGATQAGAAGKSGAILVEEFY